MKFMLTTIVILLFSLLSFCPQGNTLVIFEAPVIKPYEAVWNATCYVESRFNAYAVGDTALSKWSYGIAQIREELLDDYYQQTGIRYNVEEMFDPVKSKEVFIHYACQFHPTQLEQIARCWNGGCRGMNKISTKPYYRLILSALENS